MDVQSFKARAARNDGVQYGRSKAVVALVAVGVAFRLFGADIDFRPPCVVPAPMEMSYQADVAVRLDDAVVFRVACSDAKAVGWVCDKAKAWWGVAGESRFAAAAEDENAQTALPPGEESYALSAKPGRIEISASSLTFKCGDADRKYGLLKKSDGIYVVSGLIISFY